MVPVWGNPPHVQCALHTQSYQSKGPAHPQTQTYCQVSSGQPQHLVVDWSELVIDLQHFTLRTKLGALSHLNNTFKEVLCMCQNAALNHGMQEEKRVRKEGWQLHSYTWTLTGNIQTMGRRARLAEGTSAGLGQRWEIQPSSDTAEAVTLYWELNWELYWELYCITFIRKIKRKRHAII